MKVPYLLLAGLLATPTAALAQQKLQPGLWEMSMTTHSAALNEAMARAQQQLASMPPERRKQMQALMAQQGVSLGAGAGPGQPMSVKVCITPEQAARDEMPAQEGRCKQTHTERSGHTLRYAFSCEDGSSGEGEFTLSNPKAHSGTMVVNAVRGGKTERVQIQQSGRWLAADCGAVKPRP